MNNRKSPGEKEVERSLAALRPQPGERFWRRMEQAPWMTAPASRRTPFFSRRKAAALSGIAILLFVAVIAFSPSGRVAALKLFRYFQSAGSDQASVIVTPPGTKSPNLYISKDYFSLTIDEAQNLAGFKVYSLGSLPEGFTFTGGRYDPETDTTALLYSHGEDVLLLTQRRLGKVNETGSIGASAEVQQVTVRGQTGEYVHGGWRTQPFSSNPLEQAYPATQASLALEWDADLNQALLKWEEDGFAFQILASGLERLDKQTMISFAEGMNDE